MTVVHRSASVASQPSVLPPAVLRPGHPHQTPPHQTPTASGFAEHLRRRAKEIETGLLADGRAAYEPLSAQLPTTGASLAHDDEDAFSDEQQPVRDAPGEEMPSEELACALPFESTLGRDAQSGEVPVAIEHAATTTMPELFARFVTRAAIGGDARRGSLRLELGGTAGRQGELVVHADGDDLEIELAGAAVDGERLEARVVERLARKGLTVRRFDLR